MYTSKQLVQGIGVQTHMTNNGVCNGIQYKVYFTLFEQKHKIGMAPEIKTCKQQELLSYKCSLADIYSLGVVFFKLYSVTDDDPKYKQNKIDIKDLMDLMLMPVSQRIYYIRGYKNIYLVPKRKRTC